MLRDLDEVLLAGVTHWQHPRYFAYFATSASEPAILAELLAATLNSVAILWRTAPAATELEGVVLDWTAELLGLPSGWHGHIEDTASTSTLAAIIAAREATGRELVVLLRAGALVGREGGADARHDAAQGPLRRRVPAARAKQLGGSQRGSGGRRDRRHAPRPRRSIRCRRSPTPASAPGAWLHVDAAYAGAAMVCPEHRWAFAGVDRADSVVVNAHKWMLTPMDCSLLWTAAPRTSGARSA